MSDVFVTTKVSGAKFADGSTLSGTWTAEYSSAGTLLAVSNASFIVMGSGGTTTYSSMGTLPYAQSASSSSYEIHSLSSSGGSYGALYVDWKSENPSSFYEGSPSLYTSVVNPASSSPTTPLRLISDGVSGSGSVPGIAGLASTESGVDSTALSPFSGVSVTDTDSSGTTYNTGATITLTRNGVATDADGLLSGQGLTHTGAGTYALASTSPAALSTELQALKFTPTTGQVAVGSSVATLINLSVNDSDGSTSASTTLTVQAVCFLRGTMIATPSGDVAVESLRPGDQVTVVERGMHVARPVTWSGRGTMDAACFGYRDEAYPVRIRKHAIADHVPQRDLLLTQEHCILTESGFVPARMLVNGRSIVLDRCIPRYDYFHVELERHGILLSEGLATESYLDTGNRDLFVDSAAGVCVRGDLAMAAPLAVARAVVEPIWGRLAERARILGLESSETPAAVTDQPDLRLLLDDGTELPACWHNGRRHMFHIPPSTRALRLLSRAAVPARTVGPFVDDRRTLGVAVGALVLWTGLRETVVPVAGLQLDGWHPAEGDSRWTNGRAELDLPEAGAETFLDVLVSGTTLYPEELAA